MVVEINENDCSVIRWSPDGKTDWKSANIDDLIHAYDQKIGQWLDRDVFDNASDIVEEWQSARCSQCNKYLTTPYMYYFDLYKYCPNCGAKMENNNE